MAEQRHSLLEPPQVYGHKPIFRLTRIKGRGKVTTISCDCRAVLGKHSRNPPGEFFEPMPAGPTDNLYEVYNNPENHYAPFGEKDKLRL